MHNVLKIALVAAAVSFGAVACSSSPVDDPTPTTTESETTAESTAALKANGYTCFPSGGCDCTGVPDCINMINYSCRRGTICYENAGVLRCTCWNTDRP